ncbi:hypothetical protein TNCV_4122821 [Trichonephila clavipes]|nr:hypothetical protein TNCV_4122821 [Trichonephila clavipes]
MRLFVTPRTKFRNSFPRINEKTGISATFVDKGEVSVVIGGNDRLRHNTNNTKTNGDGTHNFEHRHIKRSSSPFNGWLLNGIRTQTHYSTSPDTILGLKSRGEKDEAKSAAIFPHLSKHKKDSYRQKTATTDHPSFCGAFIVSSEQFVCASDQTPGF